MRCLQTRCRECGRIARSAGSDVSVQPSRAKRAGAPRVSRLRCHAVEPVVAQTVIPIKELEALLPKKEHRARTIVVAIDGTDDCLDGLRWLAKNTVRKGDTIHLVSVVNNDRAMPVSVGSTGKGGRTVTASLDDEYGFDKTLEYGERLADKMLKTILTRFAPVLKDAGFDAQCYVNTVHGHKSAADIAESLVSSAIEAGADMLAVTSHGGGLKCSYGSVARYVASHFPRAVLLLPPGVAQHRDASSSSLSLGINHVGELQDATCWGIDNLFLQGDKVNVLHSAEVAMAKRDTADQFAIMSGLREQLARHSIKDLTYTNLRPPNAEDTTQEQLNKISAAELLRKAEEKRSRALVMVNYASQGLMQEMMFGTLAMLVSRDCNVPLALVPKGYAHE